MRISLKKLEELDLKLKTKVKEAKLDYIPSIRKFMDEFHELRYMDYDLLVSIIEAFPSNGEHLQQYGEALNSLKVIGNKIYYLSGLRNQHGEYKFLPITTELGKYIKAYRSTSQTQKTNNILNNYLTRISEKLMKYQDQSTSTLQYNRKKLDELDKKLRNKTSNEVTLEKLFTKNPELKKTNISILKKIVAATPSKHYEIEKYYKAISAITIDGEGQLWAFANEWLEQEQIPYPVRGDLTRHIRKFDPDTWQGNRRTTNVVFKIRKQILYILRIMNIMCKILIYKTDIPNY